VTVGESSPTPGEPYFGHVVLDDDGKELFIDSVVVNGDGTEQRPPGTPHVRSKGWDAMGAAGMGFPRTAGRTAAHGAGLYDPFGVAADLDAGIGDIIGRLGRIDDGGREFTDEFFRRGE